MGETAVTLTNVIVVQDAKLGKLSRLGRGPSSVAEQFNPVFCIVSRQLAE
jgi:hypothetical protein